MGPHHPKSNNQHYQTWLGDRGIPCAPKTRAINGTFAPSIPLITSSKLPVLFSCASSWAGCPVSSTAVMYARTSASTLRVRQRVLHTQKRLPLCRQTRRCISKSQPQRTKHNKPWVWENIRQSEDFAVSCTKAFWFPSLCVPTVATATCRRNSEKRHVMAIVVAVPETFFAQHTSCVRLTLSTIEGEISNFEQITTHTFGRAVEGCL